MANERKGILTEDQEKLLDELIKLKGIPEKLDGLAIRLIDNKAIPILLKSLPDPVKEIIFDVIDMIFDTLQELTEKPLR